MERTTERLKTLARKVKITVRYGAHLDWDKQEDWQRQANSYHCTLRYKGRQYSFDYWCGVGIEREPDAETCLDSLLSDAQSGELSFEDFCGELGYDQDSRKAERIHNACHKASVSMQRLLGEDFLTFLYSDRN